MLCLESILPVQLKMVRVQGRKATAVGCSRSHAALSGEWKTQRICLRWCSFFSESGLEELQVIPMTAVTLELWRCVQWWTERPACCRVVVWAGVEVEIRVSGVSVPMRLQICRECQGQRREDGHLGRTPSWIECFDGHYLGGLGTFAAPFVHGAR